MPTHAHPLFLCQIIIINYFFVGSAMSNKLLIAYMGWILMYFQNQPRYILQNQELIDAMRLEDRSHATPQTNARN